jgi:hypothetical protein
VSQPKRLTKRDCFPGKPRLFEHHGFADPADDVDLVIEAESSGTRQRMTQERRRDSRSMVFSNSYPAVTIQAEAEQIIVEAEQKMLFAVIGLMESGWSQAIAAEI